MKTNPGPAYIAFIASVFVTLISAIILWFVELESTAVLVGTVIIFICSFAIFFLLLQYFIQQKVKMIYQNIYRFKARDKKVLNLLDKPLANPLSDVSDDVFGWMQDNKKELMQLKEQEAFRREFIGNVSHELKTPVFNVQGYIHTLLDGALEDKDVNRKFLRKAARGIDRLAETVEELTAISEIQAGRLQLNLEKFNLVELIYEVFETVEKMASEKNAVLKLSKQSLRAAPVYADRKRVRQIMLNLVVNAIKYGKEEGLVEVSFTNLHDKVLISVSDNGWGIDEKHLNRLFERFYRVDDHRSREQGGSGLGLSIVKHLIEAHGENIDVRSEIGQGTTFEFTLTKA